MQRNAINYKIWLARASRLIVFLFVGIDTQIQSEPRAFSAKIDINQIATVWYLRDYAIGSGSTDDIWWINKPVDLDWPFGPHWHSLFLGTSRGKQRIQRQNFMVCPARLIVIINLVNCFLLLLWPLKKNLLVRYRACQFFLLFVKSWL